MANQYDKLLAKASKGTASFASAIKAKCVECVNEEQVKERVGGCTVRRCPLWAYRPFRPEGEGRARRKRAPRPNPIQQGRV